MPGKVAQGLDGLSSPGRVANTPTRARGAGSYQGDLRSGTVAKCRGAAVGGVRSRWLPIRSRTLDGFFGSRGRGPRDALPMARSR
jgi:hypothetical protein